MGLYVSFSWLYVNIVVITSGPRVLYHVKGDLWHAHGEHFPYFGGFYLPVRHLPCPWRYFLACPYWQTMYWEIFYHVIGTFTISRWMCTICLSTVTMSRDILPGRSFTIFISNIYHELYLTSETVTMFSDTFTHPVRFSLCPLSPLYCIQWYLYISI
jgi:hypothetical protein